MLQITFFPSETAAEFAECPHLERPCLIPQLASAQEGGGFVDKSANTAVLKSRFLPGGLAHKPRRSTTTSFEMEWLDPPL
jgi:hypothetical protein